jgi:hypothetical protein
MDPELALRGAGQIADEVLLPAAMTVEASGQIPLSHLDLLAAENLYGRAGTSWRADFPLCLVFGPSAANRSSMRRRPARSKCQRSPVPQVRDSGVQDNIHIRLKFKINWRRTCGSQPRLWRRQPPGLAISPAVSQTASGAAQVMCLCGCGRTGDTRPQLSAVRVGRLPGTTVPSGRRSRLSDRQRPRSRPRRRHDIPPDRSPSIAHWRGPDSLHSHRDKNSTTAQPRGTGFSTTEAIWAAWPIF